MPKVPVYDSPQAQQAPLRPQYEQVRPAQAGADAFGGGVAQGLQQLGQGLDHVSKEAAQLHEEETKKANAARVMDAYSKLGQWQNTNLYDPKAGALAQQGEKALGKQDTYLADFDKTANAISEALGNDDQRATFAHMRMQERDSVYKELARHERGQFEAVAKEKFNGVLDTAITNGANRNGDPHSLELGETAITAFGSEHGWPAEQTKATLGNFRAKFHGTVLDKFLAPGGSLQSARDYFEATKDTLGAKADDYGRVIAQKELGVHSEETVSGLLSVARDKFGRVVPEQASNALEAMEMEPEAKKQARELLDHRVKEVQAFEKQEVEQHFDTAYTAYLRGGLGAVDAKERVWLETKAPQKWDQLRKEARTDARAGRTSDVDARRAAAEERRAQAAENALALADYGAKDVKEQASLDINAEYVGHADETTRLRIQKLQNRAKKDLEKGEIPARQEFEDLVAGGLKGLDPKKEAPQFRAYMNGWRAQWYADHDGKGPTRSESEKELGAARANVLVEGKLWGTNEKPKWKVDPAKDKVVGPADQPAAPANAVPVAPAGKVAIITADGRTGRIDAASVDAYLKANPGARRR